MLAQLKRKSGLLIAATLLVLFGFVVGTAVVPGAASPAPAPAYQPPVIPTLDIQQLGLLELEERFATLYNEVSPSVVAINVVSRSSTGRAQRRDRFDYGSGSGFIIDTAGHIVTNFHVVENALPDGIEVNFFDGTMARAQLIATDADSDLAVIRVNLPPERLRPVPVGDSDKLVIGQMVIAIGSPFGQRWTMTTGVISALDRTIRGLSNFSIGSVIQTDAAINPGNSGGPLLNLRGEVIGVNSQIISQTRSNTGVGFAVPSNLVKRVVEELLSKGRVDYSYLGIGGDDVTLTIIEELGLPDNLRGVVVQNVIAGEPAAQAGLRNPGSLKLVRGIQVPTSADIITAIDGQPISGMSALISYLARNTRPGDTVVLTVWRNGQELTLPVRLAARPKQ
ncbi:MAG: S1C family serine protease [Aggregatilineales bacterium]